MLSKLGVGVCMSRNTAVLQGKTFNPENKVDGADISFQMEQNKVLAQHYMTKFTKITHTYIVIISLEVTAFI